jgi:hypothetical protein
MGHAIHFLERLARIDDAHIEQVMSLYYSSTRTQAVINLALNEATTCSEQHDDHRVALALDDSDSPPYLIANRTGRMITCLAPGMVPYGIDVISGSTLARACHQYDDLKSRSDALVQHEARQQTKKHKNIFNPLFKDMWAVPRSTIRGLSFMHSWLELEFFHRALGFGIELNNQRDALVRDVRRAQANRTKQGWVSVKDHSKMTHKLRQRYDKKLRHYWEDCWAMAHLMTLSVCQPSKRMPGLLQKIAAKHQEENPSYAGDARVIGWSLVRQGSLPLTLRGVWATSQMGEVFVDGAENSIGHHVSYLGALNHLLPLGVVAIRDEKLRPRAIDLLTRASNLENCTQNQDLQRTYEIYAKMVLATIEEAEQVKLAEGTLCIKRARKWYTALCTIAEQMDTKIPCPVEDVPQDVLMTFASMLPGLAHGPGQGLYDDLVFYLPWLARVDAEQFYLPDEFVPLIEIWHAEFCADMLLGHAANNGHQFATQPSAPKIGRNDPCSCGSGKKYKICCLPKEIPKNPAGRPAKKPK